MYRVFEGFRFSLLHRNHFATLVKEAFILSAASSSVAPVVMMVVSSANLTNSAVLSQLFMSLTYIKNRMGPSIDPCGTPSCMGC